MAQQWLITSPNRGAQHAFSSVMLVVSSLGGAMLCVVTGCTHNPVAFSCKCCCWCCTCWHHHDWSPASAPFRLCFGASNSCRPACGLNGQVLLTELYCRLAGMLYQLRLLEACALASLLSAVMSVLNCRDVTHNSECCNISFGVLSWCTLCCCLFTRTPRKLC